MTDESSGSDTTGSTRTAAPARDVPPSRLQRFLIGKGMNPWQAAVILLGGPVLIAADAIGRQFADQPGLMPGMAPMLIGLMLGGTAHLMSAEHAKQRLAAAAAGSLLVTIGSVLLIVDWFAS